MLNETHDPALNSWVASANVAGTDFPIQNLPLGVFRRRNSQEACRVGVAIGDQVLDVASAAASDSLVLEPALLRACSAPTLNALMALGNVAGSSLRSTLSGALRSSVPATERLRRHLVPMADAEMALPAEIGDYTDFYASIHHAAAVGRLFRPDAPLPANYRFIPIGYHGRASSIGVSGESFRRPSGQSLARGESRPVLGLSRRMDYELELGVWIGVGNARGEAIRIADAGSHIFGLSLLNDWSARDIQAWEYQPLGPFLGKNFATTVSPWVVTLEALAPFRVRSVRSDADPDLLPYLVDTKDSRMGAFDISLEVGLLTPRLRVAGSPPARLSVGNFRDAFWTIAQMVAHHTVSGCNLQTGDLLGTGTLSGSDPAAAGSLLELSAGGSRPVPLPNGETRTFLEDDDTVILRAWCEAPGAVRIGFGACEGTLRPA